MNAPVLLAAIAFATPSLLAEPLSIARTNYHGWADSLWLRNGEVEVIVVPAIGRIMRLGFIGAENVLWENRTLDGQALDGRHTNWINFGGDKSWPSPEADWGKFTGDRSWFPPRGFDGLPATAAIDGEEIVLTHPVDPHYGIRTVRRISLDREAPVVTVQTVYERVQGAPAKIGIWIITQLNDPDAVVIPVPKPSIYPEGYHAIMKPAPPSLLPVASPRWMLLSLKRDVKNSYKIGTDASVLIWVGEKTSVRIDSARVAKKEYPDKNSSAEVYTNGGELKYVELEMLGPLQTLKVGDTLRQTNVYTLRRRTEAEPHAEAVKLLPAYFKKSGK